MLFNLFFQKKPKIEIISTLPNIDALSVNIRYDNDNNLLIDAQCNDKSDPIVVATALYMLNNGQLLASILESLLKNNTLAHQQLFLNKVLVECNNLFHNKEKNNNDPIVNPSDVFIKKYEK